jgi:hypothetical protein
MGKHARTTHGKAHEKIWEKGESIEGFDRLVVFDLRQPFEDVHLGFAGQYLGL